MIKNNYLDTRMIEFKDLGDERGSLVVFIFSGPIQPLYVASMPTKNPNLYSSMWRARAKSKLWTAWVMKWSFL